MTILARFRRQLGLILVVLLLCVSVTDGSAAGFPELPALNIDSRETSISGLSSGGFMAVQFAVAYSSLVKGVGIIAGGPFYCAHGSTWTALTLCSCTGEPLIACEVTNDSAGVPELIAVTHELYARRRLIDNPSHITHQRIIAIAGERDEKVPKEIAAQLEQYYKGMGVPPENFLMKPLPRASHTLPTPDYGGPCEISEHPYIGRCGFDSAEAILSWIYNDRPLQPATKPREENFIQFNQEAYIPEDWPRYFLWMTGLDSSAWIYIPKSCARGEPCRLHIALHGCRQAQHFDVLGPEGYYGTRFVKHSGYARWADNNNIVILFPQADTVPYLNINGCWDWFGYTDANYANQDGVQIRTLKAMVDRLTAGYTPRPGDVRPGRGSEDR